MTNNKIIGIDGLRRVLESHGVKTKHSKSNEFSICCYKCGDTKFRMQVNPAKVHRETTGWCFCYRRDCVATVQGLLNHHNIDYEMEQEYVSTNLQSVKVHLHDLKNPKQSKAISSICVDFSFFSPISKSDSWVAQNAKEYLIGRGFTENC